MGFARRTATVATANRVVATPVGAAIIDPTFVAGQTVVAPSANAHAAAWKEVPSMTAPLIRCCNVAGQDTFSYLPSIDGLRIASRLDTSRNVEVKYVSGFAHFVANQTGLVFPQGFEARAGITLKDAASPSQPSGGAIITSVGGVLTGRNATGAAFAIASSAVDTPVSGTIAAGASVIFPHASDALGQKRPFFDLVRSAALLLKFDGSNSQTTTIDSASSPHTITLTNSTLSTSLPKFGTAALSLNGTTGYASVASSGNEWEFTGDFSVSCWVKTTSTRPYDTIMSTFPASGGTNRGWILLTNHGSTNQIAIYTHNESGSFVLQGNRAGFNDGNWHHVAAFRVGSTISLYCDGTLVASGTYTGTFNYSTAASITIGNDAKYSTTEDPRFLPGSIDDVLITKGWSPWSGSYAVPTSSASAAAYSPVGVVGWSGGSGDYVVRAERLSDTETRFTNTGSIALTGRFGVA